MDIKPGLEEWWENTDALKENRKIIKKKLRECMKANGYKQGKHSCFYQYHEDAVIYYVPEHPSIMMYLWICYYPLYMLPGDIAVFSFGERLSYSTNHYIWNIRDYETEESMDEWCRRITKINNTNVSLLSHQVSSATSVNRLFENNKRFFEENGYIDFAKLFRLETQSANELLMYTKLALHEYDYAIKLANQIMTENNSHPHGGSERIIRKCQDVINMAERNDNQYVDSVIQGWRETNIQRFIKK